jgi:hypothetical protein
VWHGAHSQIEEFVHALDEKEEIRLHFVLLKTGIWIFHVGLQLLLLPSGYFAGRW